MAYTRFTLDSSTPSLWRVTFNHPPVNLIDSVMIGELGQLFAAIERNEGPAVLLFDSADPDYFLAHYDITAANSSLVNSLPAGPTGFHPWVDILVQVSRLPAVTTAVSRLPASCMGGSPAPPVRAPEASSWRETSARRPGSSRSMYRRGS